MQAIQYFDTLIRAGKCYGRLLEPVCRRWDVTRNEMDILLFLINNPELDRAADIVSRRGIAKSHVSQSVNSLAGKGLLLCSGDSRDRRTVRLKLTEAALPAAREGQEIQRAFLARIHRGITGEERELLRKVVLMVRSNLDIMEE